MFCRIHFVYLHCHIAIFTTDILCNSAFRCVISTLTNMSNFYGSLFTLVPGRGHSPCEFLHNLYIAKIYRLGTNFLLLVYCGSVFIRFYTGSSGKAVSWFVMVALSHSRSSKLVLFESLYAIYNCIPFNSMPIFYCFRDITIHWSKICIFRRFFTHPIFVWSLGTSGTKVGFKKRDYPSLELKTVQSYGY